MTETSLDERLLLRPEECARALSVGRSMVYQLMASGRLRSVKIARCRRVPATALRSFVEELEREQQGEGDGLGQFSA